jgi:LysM repeat protein
MDKLNELKALAELAQQLEENGHYVEANTVHNQFIRLAQKQTNPIGPGDSYTTIARQYGVSVDALKAANPPRKDQQDPSKLYPGDRLNLPAPVKEPSLMESVQKGLGDITNLFTGKKEAPKKPMAPVQKPITHKVLPGQSLSLIGSKYGVPWQKIQKDNGIDKSTDIHPGQELVIKK